MFIAHGPLSVLANEVIQKKNISKLTKEEHIVVLLLSLFFGILPDFDLLLLSMTEIPSYLHHQVFTHSFLFWISIWILLRLGIYLLKKISKKELRKILESKLVYILQYSFLIGVISHLFADILLSYSQVLFPLQNEVTILGGLFKKNYFSGYIYSVGTAVELGILSLFVLYIYKTFLKENKYIKYSIYSLLVISSILILFNGYMNINTYNKAVYKVEGRTIYDEDFDTLIDYKDADIDNDGRDNILDRDRKKLVESVYTILEKEGMVAQKGESLWDGIKYRYGALNSYRLISQAYFNQNRAMEPVLKIFAQKNSEEISYSIEEQYDDLLYKYFQERKMFRDLTRRAIPGNLLFVLDEGEKVVNMGIALNNDEIGIVLPTDNRAQIHTLEEVSKYYPEYTIRMQR